MTHLLLALSLFVFGCSSASQNVGTAPNPSLPNDSILVIALGTGHQFRFKGLAVDEESGMAYLGSWDKQCIVAVDMAKGTHKILPTPYNGRLNGMDTYLRDSKLYAVMNEVNDEPNASPIAVLVVFDITSGKILKQYEAVGKGGRHHFNHVVVDKKGVAYISNTLKSSIYTVNTNDPADQLKPLVEDERLSWVHGIDLSADGKRLFTTSYDGGIRIFEIDKHRFTPYQDTTDKGNDGLKYHRGCLFGVGDNILKKYTLNTDETAVIKSEIILQDHAVFNDARCLHLAGDWLYCLANIEFEPVDFGRKVPMPLPLHDSHLIKLNLSENQH